MPPSTTHGRAATPSPKLLNALESRSNRIAAVCVCMREKRRRKERGEGKTRSLSLGTHKLSVDRGPPFSILNIWLAWMDALFAAIVVAAAAAANVLAIAVQFVDRLLALSLVLSGETSAADGGG